MYIIKEFVTKSDVYPLGCIYEVCANEIYIKNHKKIFFEDIYIEEGFMIIKKND